MTLDEKVDKVMGELNQIFDASLATRKTWSHFDGFVYEVYADETKSLCRLDSDFFFVCEGLGSPGEDIHILTAEIRHAGVK